MPPIPILLLTGFLGAGKTTLLNRLLALPAIRDKQIALVINEFGAAAIDGALVQSGERPKFELNKGSLFCICVKTDFLATLREIAQNIRPQLVVIEATGIAETRDLMAFVDEPHLMQTFRIQANICLVDALNFTKVAPNLKAARGQVVWADALVINKTDLVPPAELAKLRALLDEMNPAAPRVEVVRGDVSSDFIENLTHTERPGTLLPEPPDPLFSSSFQTANPVDRHRFRALVAHLSDSLLRLKGWIDFGNGPEFVELVGDTLSERPADNPHAPQTRFVVIAWKIRQAELEKQFETLWT